MQEGDGAQPGIGRVNLEPDRWGPFGAGRSTGRVQRWVGRGGCRNGIQDGHRPCRALESLPGTARGGNLRPHRSQG